MSSSTPTDPLSFFAGEGSSSSESEDEDEKKSQGQSREDSSSASSNPNKLPSPDSLFASVKRPSFLTDPNSQHINWDNFVKKDEPNIHLDEGGAAIAPPKDLGEHNRKVHTSLSAAIIRTYSNTGGEISAPPIRYSTEDVDAKFRTVSDNSELASSEVAPPPQGTKRVAEGGEGEGETKKTKTENFRQKEKRKRDMGQTSRGKSYVEEEKRILRQQFATDEVMN